LTLCQESKATPVEQSKLYTLGDICAVGLSAFVSINMAVLYFCYSNERMLNTTSQVVAYVK